MMMKLHCGRVAAIVAFLECSHNKDDDSKKAKTRPIKGPSFLRLIPDRFSLSRYIVETLILSLGKVEESM